MNWDKIDSRKAIQVQACIADKGPRFFGFVIDRVLGYSIAVAFFSIFEIISPGSLDFIAENGVIDKLVTHSILLIYYLLLEFFFQKTIGKMILKTKVINVHDGTKPSFGVILKRTLSRLIGIEALFYLFGNHLWHDSWSDTVVISEKKFAEQEELNEIGNIGLLEE